MRFEAFTSINPEKFTLVVCIGKERVVYSYETKWEGTD